MGANARRGRILAGTMVWLVALAGLAWWALASWADDGIVEASTDGAAEVDTAVTVAQTGRNGLRLHLMTPRHLVPEHRAPVPVALSDAEGRALDPDTRLVVYAAVRSSGDGPAPVVIDGPAARPMTAGELAETPLRLLPAGEPACGQVVAELRVRVALVEDQPTEVEQVRELTGPSCEGPAVVPAPDTVNLDRPVRAENGGWHDDIDQLLREPVRETRQPRRRATAPDPEPEPPSTSDPEPEPDTEPTSEPEPEREPTPEPSETEPSPEPEPEPTDPAPSPEPTVDPKPEPTVDPKPEPTAAPKPEPTADPKPAPTAGPKPESTDDPGPQSTEPQPSPADEAEDAA